MEKQFPQQQKKRNGLADDGKRNIYGDGLQTKTNMIKRSLGE